MNIFFLSQDPKTCAEMHCDQHVVKMIVEYGQMLSTAHRVCGNEDERLYKIAHLNHPSTKWCRAHHDNYHYLLSLWFWLTNEYQSRYYRVHATQKRLQDVIFDIPPLPSGASEIPQCMPDEYKSTDPIQAYRDFYKYDKSRFATYKFTNKPFFME